MRKVEGTATISIEELDRLRQREQWYSDLRGNLKGIVADINTEKYDEEMKKIDENTSDEISDEELNKLIEVAAKTLEIVINENTLRKLIPEFIDETKSDAHYAISEMSADELKAIPLILSGSRNGQQGQQDKKVCEMCEEYIKGEKCDLADSCPAAGVVQKLKEAEETVKKQRFRLKEKNEEIKKLKEQVSDLQWRQSYMTDPNAIGDRHEMGG